MAGGLAGHGRLDSYSFPLGPLFKPSARGAWTALGSWACFAARATGAGFFAGSPPSLPLVTAASTGVHFASSSWSQVRRQIHRERRAGDHRIVVGERHGRDEPGGLGDRLFLGAAEHPEVGWAGSERAAWPRLRKRTTAMAIRGFI
jgi:hypothetical protein